MSTFFKKLHELIINILFPITCLSCQQEGSWLCERCFGKIPLKFEQSCGICEKMLTPSGRTCLKCKRKSSLSALLTASSYDNHLVRTLVHHYKYRFLPDIHLVLGRLLTETLLKSDLPLPDLIIPVPLHPRRHRWRGFNQAGLLAEYISQHVAPGFTISVAEHALVRKRYTIPQMSIASFRQRQQNISGAFSFVNSTELENKNILLVDDIATTGSTIFECAQVLKKAGAREVFAVVVARQNTRNDA